MALAARTQAFAPSARATKAAALAPRPVAQRLVVKAQAQKQQAAARFELPAAVRPALATVVANVIMAMPAAAEAGK